MKISIITVNLNNLTGLKSTVNSIINQSFTNFEYIIIDGGSTDGSKEYLQSIASKLTYWQSEKDNGIYNAMNVGISHANAEYLLFINSGDYLLDNEVLQNSIKYLDGTQIVYGDLLYTKTNFPTLKKYPAKLSFSFLYKESLPHPSTFILRKIINQQTGYDERFKICADWKFFLIAILKLDASYKHIDLVITAYNLDGISSAPGSINTIIDEKKKVIQEDFGILIDDIERFQDLSYKYQALTNSRYIKWALKFKALLLKIN